MIPQIEGYDYSDEYFQSFQDCPFSTVTYVGSTVVQTSELGSTQTPPSQETPVDPKSKSKSKSKKQDKKN